jgi:transcriptional regulator with PAS, ATPase and Fis domain
MDGERRQVKTGLRSRSRCPHVAFAAQGSALLCGRKCCDDKLVSLLEFASAAAIKNTTAAFAQAYRAAIVESSDDAIIGKNLDGIIQSCNAAAEGRFGYTAAELIGQSVRVHYEEATASVHRGRPVKTGISRYSESASAFVNTCAVLCCLMCSVSSATLVKMKSNRSARGGMPLVEVN